jgi:hypothetical protein
MNYLKHYCNLIRKAENRVPPEGYTEKHHTFPVSIFGKNNRVVILTAREHYIAHALLEKICIKRYGLHHYRTKKMNNAHILMKTNEYFNSHLYDGAKIRRSFFNTGENHPMYGRKHSEKSIEKMKETRSKMDKDVWRENSKQAGNRAYELGVGVHALTPEQRKDAGRKGGSISGKISGPKTYELGIGVHALTPEQRKENSKKGGNKCKELGIGVHGRTKEKRIEDSRKAGSIGGKRNKELGTGIFSMTEEEKKEASSKGGKIGGKRGGKKTKELGVGFFSMTEEEKQKARSKGGKISGNKNKELGIGIFAITPEQKSQTSKKTAKEINSQKWMCLETGHISTPGSLTKYQRNRGIDISKRKRIK